MITPMENELDPTSSEILKKLAGMSPQQINKLLLKKGLVKDATEPGRGLEITGTSVPKLTPKDYQDAVKGKLYDPS